jgi:hypothetical protein
LKSKFKLDDNSKAAKKFTSKDKDKDIDRNIFGQEKKSKKSKSFDQKNIENQLSKKLKNFYDDDNKAIERVL